MVRQKEECPHPACKRESRDDYFLKDARDSVIPHISQIRKPLFTCFRVFLVHLCFYSAHLSLFLTCDSWKGFSGREQMSVGMHVVRSCCALLCGGLGQFRLSLDHPCLVLSTWGLWSQAGPCAFFSLHQLFHPTWPNASELQVSLKLRFLFPRVTSNSRDPLGANAPLLIHMAGRTSLCLYLWVQREALAVFAALCLLSLHSFQLKSGNLPCFQELLGVGRICEVQDGKSVIEWFGREP